MDDSELLRQYVQSQCEEAFATLVSRHIDMVYSAALRHVANHHQAEEITQAVFVILAQKARSLSPTTLHALGIEEDLPLRERLEAVSRPERIS